MRIPANAITSSNPQVRARQLWGADIYTEDSDLVAVLMHTGHYTVSVHHAPASLAEVTCHKNLMTGCTISYQVCRSTQDLLSFGFLFWIVPVASVGSSDWHIVSKDSVQAFSACYPGG